MMKKITNKTVATKTVSSIFFMLSLLSLGACGGAATTATETLPTGVAADGLTVYTANCTTCHGAGGTSQSGVDLASESTASIQSAVRSGPGSMTAYSTTQITSQQLADIIAYLATL